MKTPEELLQIWIQSCTDKVGTGMPFNPEQFIEYVQRDAINSQPANTTKQQELELAGDVIENLKFQIDVLTDDVERYKNKWHEARRYLRQANKGAERNNQVMRLQAVDICRLLERIKQLEQHNQ